MHDIRVLRDHADEVDGLRLDKEREVGAGDVLSAELGAASDGAEAGVGVLEVGPGVAFEGSHNVDVELVVVDSAECQ